MKKQLTKEQALHKAAALCSAGEKSTYDIQEKLVSWGITETDTHQIIKYLTDENFLSDKRFAEAYTKDKFRFGKWGRIKISYALKQKHIESQTIQEALNVIDEDEYEALLYDLLKSKLKGLKYKDGYDKQAKLFRFALSRGFENNIIASAIKQL